MLENEIDFLKTKMLSKKTLWIPDQKTARQIVRIGNRKDEPSSCAYFDNGEYVALYNCDLTDFFTVDPIVINS